MSKLAEARTSAIVFDGAAQQHMQSGEKTLLSNANVTGTETMVPWQSLITELYVNVRTAGTRTDYPISVGTKASATAYGQITVNLLNTGVVRVAATAANGIPSPTISPGDVVLLTFPTDSATPTGVVSAVIIASPNAFAS